MERFRRLRRCAALLAALLGTGSVLAAATLQVTVTDGSGAVLTGAVVALQRPQGSGAVAPRGDREWVVDQHHRQFLPRVLAIRRGDRVSFPNSDNVRHHVYSFSPAKVFELPLYAGEPSAPVIFEQAGKVELGCNIHDEMIGFIYVIDGADFQVTEAGRATFSDLAPGAYRFTVEHPDTAVAQPHEAAITLADGATVQTSVALELRSAATAPAAGSDDTLSPLERRFRELRREKR